MENRIFVNCPGKLHWMRRALLNYCGFRLLDGIRSLWTVLPAYPTIFTTDMAYVVISAILLVTAETAFAKSEKYTAENIGAEKTCKSDGAAVPVKDCMNEFAEKFCKEKGHKTHMMVSWSSSGDGYSDPDVIYCK